MTLRRTLLIAWMVWSVMAAHGYARVWRSDESLWRHAIQITPMNPHAHLNYAMAVGAQGRFDESAREALRAMALR